MEDITDKRWSAFPNIDFWQQSTDETYHAALGAMIDTGWKRADAVELLESVYYATAEEFGG